MPVHNIRPAGSEDIPLINELAKAIWPGAYGQIITPEHMEYALEQSYSPAALKQQMSDNHNFLIIEDDGIPVGFADYGPMPEPETCKLHKIYVLPSQQGKGTGKALLQAVTQLATKTGAKQLILNVNRYNKARYFYEKAGFTILYEEDKPIGGGYYMNDYVMRLQI
jgi:diamine N-acetyltransferase